MNLNRMLAGTMVTVWVSGLFFPASLLAADVTFERVVGTGDVMPGSTATFATFDSPSLDGGNVAFQGYNPEDWLGNPTHYGLYKYVNGGLQLVADETTEIPSAPPLYDGSARRFVDFSRPTIRGTSVAFQGGDRGGWHDPLHAGIYVNAGGGLNAVVSTNTPMPGGTGSFTQISTPSFDSGHVAFCGTDGLWGTQAGIYTNATGSLDVVADLTTQVPGGTPGETFASLQTNSGYRPSPVLRNESVVFDGASASVTRGVYLWNAAGLSVVADSNTVFPGPRPTLTPYNYAHDGQNVAIVAAGGDTWNPWAGVYVKNGDSLEFVCGTLDGYTEIAIDNGNIVLWESTRYGQRLITNVTGEFTEIIRPGDALDGKILGGFAFASEGFSGDQVAFLATFTDGTHGIYIATIPEPSNFALVALGGLSLLLRWQTSRRRK